MTADRLSEVVAREPFQPFAVTLRDGERIAVHRPLRALVTETLLLLGVDEDPQTGLAARLRKVSLADVTEVEPIPSDR